MNISFSLVCIFIAFYYLRVEVSLVNCFPTVTFKSYIVKSTTMIFDRCNLSDNIISRY